MTLDQLKEKPELIGQIVSLFTAQQNASMEGADGAACKFLNGPID